MKILAVFGRDAYGNPARGEAYEHANILPDLTALGSETRLFDCWDRSAHANFADLNSAFLRTVADFKPDVIFMVLMGYEIWTETLDLIRTQTPAALIHWATDDSWKFDQHTRFIAPHVDLQITTHAPAIAKAQRLGITNMVLSQWAASSQSLRPPIPSADCRYDVTFIGKNYGNRPEWIAALKQRGIDVTCFGGGWDSGVIPSSAIPDIIQQSRISLNFSDSGLQVVGGKLTHSRQIKARTFEVPGSGGFLLTEPADTLDQYLNLSSELITYDTADDLAVKIKHYLSHPAQRDAIANAAHAGVARDHTYAARFPNLIAQAQANVAAGNPTRRTSTLDPTALAPAIARHTCGPALTATRWAITRAARIATPANRATPAARRIIYETSWRTLGARTYTAAGLPGRLFYHEQ
jgi:spore maturation protein CgeB